MAAGALMGPMVLSAVFNGPVATRALAGPVSLGVGVLGALGLAGRLGAGAKAMLHGILCSVGLGVALTSWWGVAFRRYPWGLEADGLWRGSSVLTYANTTAAVLVGLSLAAAAWVCGTRRKSLLGFGYRVLLFVLLLGFGVTQSRAGAGAALAGGIVLAASQRRQRTLTSMLWETVPVLCGAAVATVGVIATSATDVAGQPLLALLWSAVGLVVVLISTWFPPKIRRSRAAAALAVGVFGAAVVLATTDVLPAQFLRSRVTLVAPQSGSVEPTGTVGVLGDRAHAWRVAAGSVVSHPWLGVGPGRLRMVWVSEDGQMQRMRYVHNEFLEHAATYGLLGLAGLVAAGATVVAQGSGGRGRSGRVGSMPTAAIVVSFTVHSSFDYLWHQSLVPVFIALLVGLCLSGGNVVVGEEEPAKPRYPRP